jgi:hypothetical protein
MKVPKIFTILWKLLTPFVSERTKSKILFLGWDKSEWTREISKVVPLDQFPTDYGGTGDGKNLVNTYNVESHLCISSE